MPSTVIYGRDFGQALNQGLNVASFVDGIVLCEGDSWMDRSGPGQYSLPWALEESFNASNRNYLLVNLSRFGHTMRHMGDTLNDEFLEWVTTNWRYKALLFSASGNDFIDAALAPAGQGILNIHQPGMTAQQCFNAAAVRELKDDYLHPNFDKLVKTVRNSPQQDVKIYLNSYSPPVARDAPARPGGKAWLCEAYKLNGIPPALWDAVTAELFREVGLVVQDWATNYANVVQVPTTTVNLAPAAAGSKGSSGDWLNEIHPNKSGWRKLAPLWRTVTGL